MDQNMSTQRAKLKATADYNMIYIRETLADLDHIRSTEVRLKVNQATSIGLLTLKVWEIRYHVPLSFILKTLLKRFTLDRVPGTLGTPWGQLTGVVARDTIEQAIRYRFPGGENIKASRDELKQQLIQFQHTGSFRRIEGYANAMSTIRQHRREAKKKFPRPWRNNPWK